MDANSALLTLIAELRMNVANRENSLESLTTINDSLSQELKKSKGFIDRLKIIIQENELELPIE